MSNSVIYYRRATAEDAEMLAGLRLAFLAEVSKADASDSVLTDSIRQYFAARIPTGEFICFVAIVDSKIIATSGLILSDHPPSNRNLTGREAYVMNMYTIPEWRNRGIATRLLQMLVDHARQHDCGKISLHVMPKGRSIYAKAGFEVIETEMRLNL